ACAALYARSKRLSSERAVLAASFSRASPERVSDSSSAFADGSRFSFSMRARLSSSVDPIFVTDQKNSVTVQYFREKGISRVALAPKLVDRVEGRIHLPTKLSFRLRKASVKLLECEIVRDDQKIDVAVS